MKRIRVIPVLLLQNGGLVKTIKFKKPNYIGDPINAVKIFNEKEVDELVFLDIEASKLNKEPDYNKIEEIASECFMPLAYGGGINSIDQVKKLYAAGVEKVIVNSAITTQPNLISEIAKIYDLHFLLAGKGYNLKYTDVLLRDSITQKNSSNFLNSQSPFYKKYLPQNGIV